MSMFLWLAVTAFTAFAVGLISGKGLDRWQLGHLRRKNAKLASELSLLRRPLLGALLLAVLLAPQQGRASTINAVYDLVGGCPQSTCGTVTVTGETTSTLQFHTQLSSGYGLADLEYFNLTGVANPTFTTQPGVSAHLTGGQSPGPGFQNYADVMSCDSGFCLPPIDWSVSGATALNPFVLTSPGGAAFVALLGNPTTGFNGLVSSVLETPVVTPLPSALLLMFSGLAGLGLLLRRGRRATLTAA